MELSRFAQLLAAYGSHPQRWPEAERAAAEQLLSSSAEAQRLHAEERALDNLLDAAPVPQVSAQLAQRIVHNARQRKSAGDAMQWLLNWLWGNSQAEHWWRPALALGLPALCGIALGSLVAQQQQQQLNEQFVMAQLSQDEVSSVVVDENREDVQTLASEWSEWL